MRSGGLELAHTSLGLQGNAEAAFGRIELEGSGMLEVEFPPLQSHGSLRARRVSVAAGETLRIALGPDDLLGASVDRK